MRGDLRRQLLRIDHLKTKMLFIIFDFSLHRDVATSQSLIFLYRFDPSIGL